MKLVINLIGAIILGLSFIIAALIISNTLSNLTNESNHTQTTQNPIPELMTATQLSEYLQISEDSIVNIIEKDDLEKGKVNSYDTYRFIPYIKIDEQIRFLKTEIDKWLLYKNYH